MPRNSEKRLLIQAIDWALQDRRGVADAYADSGDRRTIESVCRDIERLKKLRVKLTGSSKSDMERFLAQFPLISIFDLMPMRPNAPDQPRP